MTAWPKHNAHHCRICGGVGPRTWTKRGLVHKRCLPDDERREYNRKLRSLGKKVCVYVKPVKV